jgi:hypothetical protein
MTDAHDLASDWSGGYMGGIENAKAAEFFRALAEKIAKGSIIIQHAMTYQIAYSDDFTQSAVVVKFSEKREAPAIAPVQPQETCKKGQYCSMRDGHEGECEDIPF